MSNSSQKQTQNKSKLKLLIKQTKWKSYKFWSNLAFAQKNTLSSIKKNQAIDIQMKFWGLDLLGRFISVIIFMKMCRTVQSSSV